ncbi:MAG: 50S ribosomal protein L21 [Nitrospirota bacterium]|nr:50S ribosomal protein L21 [Nitrospirota bacterium]
MYAIIENGGKQYKVAPGETVKLEKIDVKVGDTVELGKVLMIGDGEKVTVGAPAIDGAKVTAKVVEQDREKKVLVFKKKRRKGFKKTIGHRQYYTRVKIQEISA